MKNLENFIKNNKEEINSFDLPDGHLQRFEKKMIQKRNMSKGYWYSLAAALIVLISLSVFLSSEQFRNKNVVNTEQIISLSDISAQYKEVEEFYRRDLYQKMNEFNKLNCNINSEQKEMIEQELQQLDRIYYSLQEELKQNIGDERIINAMISNYQYKIEFLDLVIKQIKQNC